MDSEDLAPHAGSAARADPALRDLGNELKHVRTVVLRRNGPEMAEWLGVATRRPNGKATSTGRSLVSQFEKGRRLPDESVIEQYCRAPGTDVDTLRGLYLAAKAATSPTRIASEPTDDTLDHPGSDPSAGALTPERPATGPDRSLRGRRVRLIAIFGAAASVIAVAATVIVLVANSGDEPPASRPSATAPLAGVQLVFDALGPRTDQTINVYPGYGTARADRQSDLTFHDGDKASVICKAQGRQVVSDPATGERYRSTDIWVRIRTRTGLTRYATLTYARLVPASAEVPMCPP